MATSKKLFNFTKIGGLAAGGVLAKVANKPLANMNPKVRSIVKIGAGIFAPTLIKKNPFIEHLGDGLIAAGAGELVGAFVPALAGTDEYDSLGELGYVPTDTVELDDLNGIGETEYEEDEEEEGY